MTALRYTPTALAAATSLVRALASDDAATFFCAVVRARGNDALTHLAVRDLLEGTELAFAEGDAPERLLDACRDFEIGFEICAGLLASPDDPTAPSPLFVVSNRLSDLLDNPFPHPERRELPMPDVASGVWVAAIRAAAVSRRGAHLALRCTCDGDEEMGDLAALVGADGTAATVASDADLAQVLLRAELHAGDVPGFVAVTDRLLVRAGTVPDEEPGAEWSRQEPVPTADAKRPALRAAMGAVRNVYAWRLDGGSLPSALVGLVAGLVGPLKADPDWSRFVVGAAAPDAGPGGIDAILGAVGDPRRADAIVAMARLAADVTASAFDDGARFVARSFGRRRFLGDRVGSEPLAGFDPRLVVADHDPMALLERAPQLRAMGCRILFCGAPGGGKSSIASELCRRMVAAPSGRSLRGEAPILFAAASSLLVRDYGGTERLLTALFDEAATAGGVGGGAPILVDELDSFCGVREAGATGGNAYLVRSLTNEWLRALDSHPDVPVVATCNEVGSIDPAVLRRFALVVTVAADLPPELERLAWSSILGIEPPADWLPVGASISDIATARSRCAALGDTSPGAVAVARIRDVRVGRTPRATSRRRSLH